MELSNKKRTISIKRIFNIIMLLLIFGTLLFLYFNVLLWAYLLIGTIAIILVSTMFLSVNHIYYSSKNDVIILKYHSVIALFGNKYELIEFDKKLLWNVEIEQDGGMKNLSLSISTQRGILKYPNVNLFGLTDIEIELMKDDLKKIIENNRK